MKQFRDTDKYVNKEGNVWKYWPEKRWEDKNGFQMIRLEKWKQMKPSVNRMGYNRFSFGSKKCGNHLFIEHHRMVAELYVPGYFEGAHVDHIDSNRLNNHYTNLQWCTKEYNSKKGNDSTFPLYSEWSKSQQQ